VSENALRAGWRVYRERRPSVVDQRLLRRRRRIAAAAAVTVGAAVVVTQLLAPWIPGGVVRTALVAVAAAAGVGGIVGALLPESRTGEWRTAVRDDPDWRRTDRVQAQFRPRPPALDAADRDAVLAAVGRSTDPLVVLIGRTVLVGPALLAVWGVVLLSGGGDRLFLLVVWPPVAAVIQVGQVLAQLVALGRMDAARRRAEALDPVGLVPEPPTRNRDPRGSKLGLPGD
jgi:hypothetical protein